MTIVENGRESVRFFFGPSDWHNWKKGDGEVATRKEMNHWSVEGYVNGVTAAMSAIMGLHAVNGTGEEKFGSGAPSAGGNSGGWQKKPYQGGGNNNWKDRQGGGGWQKKPWQGGQGGNGGGQGGWQKKPWQNGNNNGNGGGWKNNNGGGWRQGGNNFGNNGGGRVEQSNEVADTGDIEF